MKLAKVSRPVVAPVVPRFDRLFDRLFGMPLDMDLQELETVWTPPIDFAETDAEYRVRLEAPGVKKEDLDITVENNVLTITGKREKEEKEETEETIWREREVGRFVRSIRLPQPVNAAKIEAHFADGVLTAVLPKAEQALKSKITIK